MSVALITYVIMNAGRDSLMAKDGKPVGFDHADDAATYADAMGLKPGEYEVMPFEQAQTILNATS